MDKPSHRFVFSPAAIRDFREIFEGDQLSHSAVLGELSKTSQHAQLQRTKASGSKVYRTSLPNEYYFLAEAPDQQGFSRVLALAPTAGPSPDPPGSPWWLPQEGDVESEMAGGPGTELAFARKALGLTVRELSELTGIPAQRLRGWEGDGPDLELSQIRQIARLVGRLHEARILAFALGNSQGTEIRTALQEVISGVS